MRRNETTIVVAVAVIGIAIAFWLLVLSPKRQQANDLKDDVAQLNTQVDEARQAADAGAQARKSFPVDYRRLVVLGKAVPEDSDQASLLIQLQRLADRSGVEFQSIDLSDNGDASTTSAASTTTTTDTTTSSSSSDSTSTSTDSTSSSASAPAAEPVATEASAATLPIGASIGPAGLPVMRYELKFNGHFFQIADFMKRVDDMVGAEHGALIVEGRLLTVDSFTLSPIVETGNPTQNPPLTADLFVTSYLTPAGQGATAGATPGGPAPETATPATATPASSSDATSASSTPTSSTP
jgi:type II secretory pathway pseudopilin PulG